MERFLIFQSLILIINGHFYTMSKCSEKANSFFKKTNESFKKKKKSCSFMYDIGGYFMISILLARVTLLLYVMLKV